MIQIQETLDADFKRVKDELTDQLNLRIINGKHNLVFNVEQHSVVSNRDVYKTMRKKLRDELRGVPQIRSVRKQKLETVFGCHCHQRCASILNIVFDRLCRRRKKCCGFNCGFLDGDLPCVDMCFVDQDFDSCPQNKARKEYEARNDTSLLVIEMQPYCETHTLNSVKQNK